jgi:hypothetical protein
MMRAVVLVGAIRILMMIRDGDLRFHPLIQKPQRRVRHLLVNVADSGASNVRVIAESVSGRRQNHLPNTERKARESNRGQPTSVVKHLE